MGSNLKRWLPVAGVFLGYVLLSSGVLLYWYHPMYLTQWQEGEVWTYRDLFAPFEFRVFRGAQEGQAWDSLAPSLTLAFERDTLVRQQVTQRLSEVSQGFSPGLRSEVARLLRYAYRFGYVNVPVADKRGQAILREGPSREEVLPLEALVDSQRLERWVAESVSESRQDSVEWVVRTFLQPDCRYDPNAVQELLQAAAQRSSPFSTTIRKGELIVRRGQLISSEVAQKLRSLSLAYGSLHPFNSRLLSFLGLVGLVGLLTFIALQYLYVAKRFQPEEVRPVLLLLSVFLVTIVGASLFLHFTQRWAETTQYPIHHLFPVAMAPIMAAIFFDDRVGFISAITLSAQVSLVMEEPVEFFFVHGLSSMLVVFRLRVLQRRSHFLYALGTLALGYWVTFLGYHLFRMGSFETIPWAGLPLLLLNALLCLMGYPLVYVLERLFRTSSDVTFLELLDLRHPLLRQLAEKAPGTYQHSLAVAELAEVAAQKIGAHSLKARVMGLFHDIGKLENPSFFIENISAISQGGGSNPHYYLSPRESAAIIRRHVEYGLELARKYNLPPEVVAGIQTHHGTTWIQYFWERQKREAPQEAPSVEAEFRYPGPLPSTKEEAILMLADSLEASTRALSDPTPEKLRAHVRSLIQQRIAEGQLDRAPLTFEQVRQLEEVFYENLLNRHHTRIPYPEPSPAR